MKLKKALALVMAAAMTFSLAGCGSSDDSASAPADDTSTADTSFLKQQASRIFRQHRQNLSQHYR